MPLYAISRINHLGERFATRLDEFTSDAAAIASARRSVRAYPLEVLLAGESLAVIPISPWRMEDWLARAIA